MSSVLSDRCWAVRGRMHATGLALLSACTAASLMLPTGVEAQALNYPAMQIPTVSYRDYSAVLVGSRGSMAMFQWREGISDELHLGLDAGLYDSSLPGARTALFVAGNAGYQLTRATEDQPVDVLLTGGLGLSIRNSRTSVRLPLGASIGHRFELDQGMAVTPFVHPRISVDICSSCSVSGRRQSDVSLNFDVGGNFEINNRLAIRAAVLFSGAEQYGSDQGIAVGLVWTPEGLRR